MTGPEGVAQLRAAAAQDERRATDPGHGRLERHPAGQPLRAPPGDERPRILSPGERLEPLTLPAELGAHRGARQPGQLAHGGQAKEREALPRLRVRGEQVQGEAGEHVARQDPDGMA